MDSSTDLIGATEAAEILGLSARHVKRMATEGDLDFVTRLAGARGDYVFSRQVITAKRAHLNRIAELEAELKAAKAQVAS